MSGRGCAGQSTDDVVEDLWSEDGRVPGVVEGSVGEERGQCEGSGGDGYRSRVIEESVSPAPVDSMSDQRRGTISLFLLRLQLRGPVMRSHYSNSTPEDTHAEWVQSFTPP